MAVFSAVTSKLPPVTKRLPLEVVGALAIIISSKVLNSYNEILTSSEIVFPLLSITEFPVHVIVVPSGPVIEKLLEGFIV